MNSSYHTPVLLAEVLSGLQIKPGNWYIDCTLGGGGYSAATLALGGNIIGIDVDTEALHECRERFQKEFPEKSESKQWILVHDNFRNIQAIRASLSSLPISGIMMDLGISSHQLDAQSRGFSYRFPESVFDLRLNQSVGTPAYEVINTATKEELYDILTKYGEEERSFSIVNALVSARRLKSLHTVGDILESLKKVLPTEKEPMLARIFQAFRISVNDELRALREGLEGSEKILESGGRLAVVSFHSLEDRIVKQHFRRKEWQTIGTMIRAGEEERFYNSRSRSAKLRIGEKK